MAIDVVDDREDAKDNTVFLTMLEHRYAMQCRRRVEVLDFSKQR